jgi:hypothetical protein
MERVGSRDRLTLGMEAMSEMVFGKKKKKSKSPPAAPPAHPHPPHLPATPYVGLAGQVLPGDLAPPPPAAPPAAPPSPAPAPARLLHASRLFRPGEVAALERTLPATLRGYNWRRLYGLVENGADAKTFYARTKHDARTLIAVETTNHEVFGGFSNSPWRPGAEYYGTGQCFLWRIDRDGGRRRPPSSSNGMLRPFHRGDIDAAPRPRGPPPVDARGRRLGEGDAPARTVAANGSAVRDLRGIRPPVSGYPEEFFRILAPLVASNSFPAVSRDRPVFGSP